MEDASHFRNTVNLLCAIADVVCVAGLLQSSQVVSTAYRDSISDEDDERVWCLLLPTKSMICCSGVEDVRGARPFGPISA